MILYSKKTFYSAAFLLSVLVLVFLFASYYSIEQRSCAGVQILSEQKYARLEETVMGDVFQYLEQNGTPAAMDTSTNTIYISLTPRSNQEVSASGVTLSCSHPDYKLYFAPDALFSDLKTAVSQNHHFKLLAVRGKEYMPYSVVFTTLPVLQLSSVSYENESYFGKLTLWNASSLSDESYYSIAASEAEWHTRGGVTKGTKNPPYKINLKKQGSREGRNLSLLDLGADDDWILHSMIYDDLKLREMAATSLWNAIQDTSNPALKLPEAKYVEVLLNGQYSGIFLLRRRVDSKSLGLQDTSSILIKKPSLTYRPPVDGKSSFVEYNPTAIPEEQLHQWLLPFLSATVHQNLSGQLPTINLENWLDLNVLMSALLLRDNISVKNMLYLLSEQNGQYILEFIPWDMDMSLGLMWHSAAKGFVLDESLITSAAAPTLRREAPVLFKQYPSLEKELAMRWHALRQDVLSEQSIWAVIESCHMQLQSSGAYHRDQARWGLRYAGEDSLHALKRNFPIHLNNMDIYYQNIVDNH